ncbi:MAG: branched-chain amino acid ABC transporter permease [Candidatus Hodarchaeales archaeon]|jgi:branched-chain amino acid transport system permease protein
MKTLSEILPVDFIEKEKTLIIVLFSVFSFLLLVPFIAFGLTDGLQIVMIGASTGALYSILALGFSLIFGVAKQLKLSLGGYYVVAAYTMYFLLEAGNIIPAFSVFEGGEEINILIPFLDISIFTFNFNFNGVLLLIVIILPIILLIAIMAYLWTVLDRLSFFLVFFGTIVSGGSFVLPQVSFVTSLYAFLVIPIVALALYHLEVSHRFVALVALIFGISVPLFLLLNFSIEIGGWTFAIADVPMVYIVFLVLSVLLTAFIAMLSDRFLLANFRYSPVNVLIVTFALALVLQSIIQLIPFPFKNGEVFIPFGVEYRDLQAIVNTNENIEILFGAKIGLIDLITLIFSILAMILLYLFIWHTRIGMAIRAVSQDEEAAALTGIDIRKITAIVSGIGMGLVAFASVLTSPYRAVPNWSPIMGWSVLILAIAIVTLGGMGSLPGTIIAAFLFAYIEIIISPFISSFSVILPFIAVILVMIFRPEGILGEKEVLE